MLQMLLQWGETLHYKLLTYQTIADTVLDIHQTIAYTVINVHETPKTNVFTEVTCPIAVPIHGANKMSSQHSK